MCRTLNRCFFRFPDLIKIGKLTFQFSNLVFQVTGFWSTVLSQFGGGGGTVDEDDEAEPMTVICYRIQ